MRFKNVTTSLDGFLFFDIIDTGADYILLEKGLRGIVSVLPFLSFLLPKRGYKISALDYRGIKTVIDIKTIQHETNRNKSQSRFSAISPLLIFGVLIIPTLLFGLEFYNIPFLSATANVTLGGLVLIIYTLYFYFIQRERKLLENMIGKPLLSTHQIRLFPVDKRIILIVWSYYLFSMILFLLGYNIYESFGNILGLLLCLFSVILYLFSEDIALKNHLLSINVNVKKEL